MASSAASGTAAVQPSGPRPGPRLTNPVKVQSVRALLGALWGLHCPATRYPGANPISIERQHLPRLTEAPYVAAEKTDGTRYALLCGVYDSTGEPYSVMVDRAMNIYELKVICDEHCFDGTLFEGELVLDHGSGSGASAGVHMAFYVFECVALRGDSFRDKNYVQRMEAVSACFDTGLPQHAVPVDDMTAWAQHAADLARAGRIVCVRPMLKPKPCMALALLPSLLRSMSSLVHVSDGLIFTPVLPGVRRGTHETMFKWKNYHTLDFALRVFFDTHESQWRPVLLYADAGGQLLDATEQGPRFRDGTASFVLQPHPKIHSLYQACGRRGRWDQQWIVEFGCSVLDEFRINPATNAAIYLVNCNILRVRKDKDVPNARRTVERTLVNIDESISAQELVDVSKHAVPIADAA